MSHLANADYWKRVVLITVVTVLIVSKSFFMLLVVTWGRLPDEIYTVYKYLGNWPSLLTGTFPYFVDSFGKPGIDIVGGLADVRSAIVNVCGWLPIGVLIGIAKRWWYGRAHQDA